MSVVHYKKQLFDKIFAGFYRAQRVGMKNTIKRNDNWNTSCLWRYLL
ncbi:hypothetical protein VRK_07380 [Vibrio sp. MEBiC08052]|nr:hypothetical protein VRK_07380 [Vibrio sp. MEBiC08052]